jgi:hypothetical protein
MTEADIRCYLGDNTDLSEGQIIKCAYNYYMRLDYGPIYEQIDTLVARDFGREHVRPSAPAHAGDDS